MSEDTFGTVIGDGALRKPYWTPQRVVDYFRKHPNEAAAAGIDMKELAQRMAREAAEAAEARKKSGKDDGAQ